MLLVDVGNSFVKWALKNAEGLTSGGSFPVSVNGIRKSMDRHWGGLDCPKRLVVSNVAGTEIVRNVKDWAHREWGIPAEFVRTQSQGFGVVNAYRDPDKLGVDRWVGLVALRQYFPCPACMVDCGTAITLDFLDGDGIHRGGLIMPGLSLMCGALKQGTAGITLSGEITDGLLGQTTEAAIGVGTLCAAAGFAELSIKRLSTEYSCEPTVVFTGGQAQLVISEISLNAVYEPDLILKGLDVITGEDN